MCEKAWTYAGNKGKKAVEANNLADTFYNSGIRMNSKENRIIFSRAIPK